jgi:hypothetical protein
MHRIKPGSEPEEKNPLGVLPLDGVLHVVEVAHSQVAA